MDQQARTTAAETSPALPASRFNLRRLLLLVAGFAGAAALARFSLLLGAAGCCYAMIALVQSLRRGPANLLTQTIAVSLAVFGAVLAGYAASLACEGNVFLVLGAVLINGYVLSVRCAYEARACALGCGFACLASAVTVFLAGTFADAFESSTSFFPWGPTAGHLLMLMWVPPVFLVALVSGEVTR